MLVLSRKEGERIIVNGPCIIEVVRIGPPGKGNVRLGITAEKDIPILREEIADESSDVHALRDVVDHSIPGCHVLAVGEAAGDVGGMVREDEEGERE